MIKKTGVTGVFEEFRREPDVSALLYDFDIDSARLKSHHRGYIEKILTPLITRKGMLVPWHIKVIGHTSASGKAKHNLDLSLRRAQAVAGLIRLNSPLRSLYISPVGVGEKYAKEWEGRLDRSVHIKAAPFGGVEPTEDPPPFEDKPLKPQPGEAQKFHLRFLKVSKVGIGFAAKLNIEIEITDRFKQRFRYYKFAATEIGASIGFPVQIGVSTKRSDYHEFWSRPGEPRVLTTSDFASDAVLIKKGLGSDEFKFGGLVPGSWSEWKYMIKPIRWNDPSFVNWDALGVMDGPMRRDGLDL